MARRNTALMRLLHEVGWSQAGLARSINTVMGAGYISRSTVSEWMNQGRVPRDPLPTAVAFLLSEAVGREVSVHEVWQGRAASSQLWLPALSGLIGPWRHTGMLRAVRDWLEQCEIALDFDRRTFLPAQGEDLVDSVRSYLAVTHKPVSLEYRPGPHRDGRRVSRSMTAIAAETLQRLRRLDDVEGATLANLRFVHRYAMNIAQYISSGEAADSAVLRELLDLWMQLCQLAGWMAYDAQQHGLAQRYWHSALHAARSLGDRDHGAYIVALLAHQSAHRNRVGEASALITAAAIAAKDASPALRSLIEGVRAYTEALIGNAYGVESSAARAHELIEDRAAYDTPPWLYWFSPATTRVGHGQALLVLADHAERRNQSRLEQAARMLAPSAAMDHTDFPRETAYNRVWLAQSQARRGEVGEALRTAAPILADDAVRSPRCLTQLTRLGADLRRVATIGDTASIRGFTLRLQELTDRTAPA